MALKKPIIQDDGVTTNYHRIVFLQMTVNEQNSIAVMSYVSDDVRKEEKEKVIDRPYMQSKTYETEYDPTMTIEKAYGHLKTLPVFKDAEDV